MLDLPLAYGVDVATFVVSVALLSRLHPMRAAAEGARVRLGDIAEGIRYAVSRRDLLGTYLIDIAAMTFAMPQALFPFLADRLGAPAGLGLLYSAGAVGSALVTLTGGWMPRVRRHGRMIVLAAAAWGLAIAAAGVAPGYWAVVACFAVAGAFDMISGVFRGAIWNSTIPDAASGPARRHRAALVHDRAHARQRAGGPDGRACSASGPRSRSAACSASARSA